MDLIRYFDLKKNGKWADFLDSFLLSYSQIFFSKDRRVGALMFAATALHPDLLIGGGITVLLCNLFATVQEIPVYKLPKAPKLNRFFFAPDMVDEEQGLRLLQEQGAWKNQGFQALLEMPPQPMRYCATCRTASGAYDISAGSWHRRWRRALCRT